MRIEQCISKSRGSRGLVRTVLGLAIVCAVFALQGNFAAASEGAKLHQKQCASCHNGMFPGGQGEMIYAPDFRKISDFKQLRQRVETCANRTNAAWFDEEIDAVSLWLNQSFYRFTHSK